MYLSNLFFFLLFAFELDSASIYPDMVLSFALYSTKVLRRTSSLIFNLLSCSFSCSCPCSRPSESGEPCLSSRPNSSKPAAIFASAPGPYVCVRCSSWYGDRPSRYAGRRGGLCRRASRLFIPIPPLRKRPGGLRDRLPRLPRGSSYERESLCCARCLSL